MGKRKGLWVINNNNIGQNINRRKCSADALVVVVKKAKLFFIFVNYPKINVFLDYPD